MFQPFPVGHSQGVYIIICTKHILKINKINLYCIKVNCCLDVGTVL